MASTAVTVKGSAGGEGSEGARRTGRSEADGSDRCCRGAGATAAASSDGEAECCHAVCSPGVSAWAGESGGSWWRARKRSRVRTSPACYARIKLDRTVVPRASGARDGSGTTDAGRRCVELYRAAIGAPERSLIFGGNTPRHAARAALRCGRQPLSASSARRACPPLKNIRDSDRKQYVEPLNGITRRCAPGREGLASQRRWIDVPEHCAKGSARAASL